MDELEILYCVHSKSEAQVLLLVKVRFQYNCLFFFVVISLSYMT